MHYTGGFKKTKNLYIFENGVWGVAPSGVRAAAPHSAPAWMPGVYAQGLCRTQSPQSVLIGIENLLHFYKNRLFLQA